MIVLVAVIVHNPCGAIRSARTVTPSDRSVAFPSTASTSLEVAPCRDGLATHTREQWVAAHAKDPTTGSSRLPEPSVAGQRPLAPHR
jgi:hypothetical protein